MDSEGLGEWQMAPYGSRGSTRAPAWAFDDNVTLTLIDVFSTATGVVRRNNSLPDPIHIHCAKESSRSGQSRLVPSLTT